MYHYRDNWENENEGEIVMLSGKKEVLRIPFYFTGEDSAECTINLLGKEKSPEIVKVVAKALKYVDKFMKKLGTVEIEFVAPGKSELNDILFETMKVLLTREERMMKLALTEADYADSENENLREAALRAEQLKISYEEGELDDPSDSDETNAKEGEKVVVCSADGFTCMLKALYGKAYIFSILTDEEKRGKGIATSCMIKIINDLKNGSLKMFGEAPEEMCLQVGGYNLPAVLLYEKLGFKVTEAVRDYTVF